MKLKLADFIVHSHAKKVTISKSHNYLAEEIELLLFTSTKVCKSTHFAFYRTCGQQGFINIYKVDGISSFCHSVAIDYLSDIISAAFGQVYFFSVFFIASDLRKLPFFPLFCFFGGGVWPSFFFCFEKQIIFFIHAPNLDTY